jgi:predicted RNA-binding Zn-ribbon protein involved in translation (DUF1610 family)
MAFTATLQRVKPGVITVGKAAKKRHQPCPACKQLGRALARRKSSKSVACPHCFQIVRHVKGKEPIAFSDQETEATWISRLLNKSLDVLEGEGL